MLYQSPHLRLAAEYRVATLTLAVAGRGPNVLTRAVLADLDAALAVVQDQHALEVLVLRSGAAAGFGAGADLGELAALDTPAEAAALAALGQRVAGRLAALAPVTVAFLDGPCLGGALELALACDYRVAVGGPMTRLGLPQVRIGAVPCWGGTVRLPRLVGLRAALDLLLSGRKLSAAQALALGLIDHAFGPRLATVHLDRLALDLQDSGRKPSRRPRLLDRLPGWPAWQLRQARARLRATVSPDHAAPWELLRVVAAGLRGGTAEGLAAERAAMGRLARSLAAEPAEVRGQAAHPTRTVANLRLRFTGDPAAHPAVPATPAPDLPPVHRIGVIGGGTVGAALAQWAALRGCAVAVQERDAAAAQLARRRLAAQFRQAADKRLLTADDIAAKLGAIPVSTNWSGFADVDLVIEAIDEDLGLKRRVLQEAERQAPAGALLATTTTALTVQALQEGLARPGRLVGLHVGVPAAALKVVEATAGPATEPAAVARLRAWLQAQGRTAALIADRPGRVLGRVLLPYLHEAALLAEEGYPVPAVDTALRKFGLAWGPFEALDVIGLDVARATLRELALTLGPTLTPPPILDRLVDAGCLGRKRGAGFYRYRAAAVPVANAEILPAPAAGCDSQVAVTRTLARLVNAAVAVLGEGLVRDSRVVEGLLNGAGWPAYRGGPLRYAKTRGLGVLVREYTDLVCRYGPRFAPCDELRRRAGRPAAPRRAVA